MQTLIIHGRQPAIGRAELESLHGANVLRPVGKIASLLELEPPEIDFMRLGGMVKFCKVLTVLDTTSWNDIENFLVDVTPQHFSRLPEGKLKIGLSVYDISINTNRLHATGLKLKKAGKQANRSIRIIPNKELVLNSATVLYNKLTQKLGWELVLIRDGQKTIVAQSIAVQDIDRYAMRDQERPFRDARVGMLPPKLAQIIINLATGKTKNKDITILDPFCGTGVIQQESQLMGYNAYGSDLEPRMIDYASKNLFWLHSKMKISKSYCTHFEVADALSYTWPHNFDVIASETYLGRPLSSAPDSQALQKITADVDTIHKKFLKNVARQTRPGFRLAIAVPAWFSQTGKFIHLPTLDKFSDLGYNRINFVHASMGELVYHRPDQIVARELVILERK